MSEAVAGQGCPGGPDAFAKLGEVQGRRRLPQLEAIAADRRSSDTTASSHVPSHRGGAVEPGRLVDALAAFQ